MSDIYHNVLPCFKTYSWEGTIVPKVTLVGEAVTDETKLAFLNVLFDRVEEFFLGDLSAD